MKTHAGKPISEATAEAPMQFTATQPNCKMPIKSPGIIMPPFSPKIELPMTASGNPVFMPNMPAAR